MIDFRFNLGQISFRFIFQFTLHYFRYFIWVKNYDNRFFLKTSLKYNLNDVFFDPNKITKLSVRINDTHEISHDKQI